MVSGILIFLIEDIENNKYGYYYNGKLTNDYRLLYTLYKSPGSFLFTLKSNGRVDKMMKFEEKDFARGLYISTQFKDKLFEIDGAISMRTIENKSSSNIVISRDHFIYHGVTNAFHSNLTTSNFTYIFPMKIIVIEMK